jgi:hypothetical protein
MALILCLPLLPLLVVVVVLGQMAQQVIRAVLVDVAEEALRLQMVLVAQELLTKVTLAEMALENQAQPKLLAVAVAVLELLVEMQLLALELELVVLVATEFHRLFLALPLHEEVEVVVVELLQVELLEQVAVEKAKTTPVHLPQEPPTQAVEAEAVTILALQQVVKLVVLVL